VRNKNVREYHQCGKYVIFSNFSCLYSATVDCQHSGMVSTDAFRVFHSKYPLRHITFVTAIHELYYTKPQCIGHAEYRDPAYVALLVIVQNHGADKIGR
jgi:hypothetical protein